MTRVISWRLFVDWDQDLDYDETFENVSAYLVSARGEMRFAPPESSLTAGKGMIANMSLTLRNADGRFSPLRTDSPLYAYIANGGMYHAGCYLEVSIDDGETYYRVFTGLLKLPGLTTVTTRQGPTLTVEARSMEEQILQRRMSSSQADFAAWHDDGVTEAELIAAWLHNAGILVGDIEPDIGLFTIPWAWLDDESPVEEIWSLASACGGRYYCDAYGIHRYENMAHWQLATRSKTVQRIYTKDDYQLLAVTYDDRDLYNAVQVENAPRMVDAMGVLWETDDPISVPAGATVDLTANFDAAAYSIAGTEYYGATAGGNDITPSLTVTITYQAQRASISIANTASVQAFVFPFKITGQVLTASPTQTERVNSADDGDNAAFFTARDLERTRTINGSFYIQTPAHAATLARYVLQRHEWPRETWKLSNCPGYAELRLGDRIAIDDRIWASADGDAASGASLVSAALRTITANETISTLKIEDDVLVQPGVTVTVDDEWRLVSSGMAAILLALAWRLDASGFHQDLEAIAANRLFRNDGEYFVLNEAGHTLNGAKKVFY